MHNDRDSDTLVNIAEDSESDTSFDVLISDVKSLKMNFGANFHKCSYQSCFSSSEKIVDMIKFVNGVELLVCGIGSIFFRMHDGVISEVFGIRHTRTSLHLISLDRSPLGCTYDI